MRFLMLLVYFLKWRPSLVMVCIVRTVETALDGQSQPVCLVFYYFLWFCFVENSRAADHVRNCFRILCKARMLYLGLKIAAMHWSYEALSTKSELFMTIRIRSADIYFCLVDETYCRFRSVYKTVV
jgi:hypothetical protein